MERIDKILVALLLFMLALLVVYLLLNASPTFGQAIGEPVCTGLNSACNQTFLTSLLKKEI